MKPSWDIAPMWARWLGLSWKGYWIWFSHKPRVSIKFMNWKIDDLQNRNAVNAGFPYVEPSPCRNWQDSLEKRPTLHLKAQEESCQ